MDEAKVTPEALLKYLLGREKEQKTEIQDLFQRNGELLDRIISLEDHLAKLQKTVTVSVTRIRQIAVQVEELRTYEALKNILDTLQRQDKRITALEG